jgi:biotin operon repressor
MMAAVRHPPARPARERGDAARQAARALLLLATAPRRPTDLAEELGCSFRTALRVLKGVQASGWKVEVDRQGREVFYSVKLP